MPLDAANLALLREVNEQVNAVPYDAIQGAHEQYDEWFDVPAVADPHSWVCRDYTIAKAERLREMDWPVGRLSVILCYTELGDYHAVLGVDDSDAGDRAPEHTWIMDNRTPNIYRMSAPVYRYRWERRQVAGTTEFEPITA